MKESVWRSKLIALRRKTNPTDFIWSMDAKFKAGFPDLYLLIDGRPVHIELKINDKPSLIQNHVLTQLAASNAQAYCFSLLPNGSVSVTDYSADFKYEFSKRAFELFWSKTTFRIDNSPPARLTDASAAVSRLRQEELA